MHSELFPIGKLLVMSRHGSGLVGRIECEFIKFLKFLDPRETKPNNGRLAGLGCQPVKTCTNGRSLVNRSTMH